MASSSRPLVHPHGASHKGNAVAPSLQKAWQATFWSPLLLLTAMVHVLCLPLTKKFLLGIVILDIPLQSGVHLAFRQDPASVGAISGYDISVTTIALFLLYIGWLFTERTENRPLRILWNWPIAIYTTVVIFSAFVASDLQLSLFQIFLMVELLLLYLYLAGNINSRRDIVFILLLLLVGGLIESSYMVITAAVGHEFAFVHALGIKTGIVDPMKSVNFLRVGGTIGSPNYAAAYLGMLITLAICIRQMSVPPYLRRLTIPTVLLCGLALALTYSRGGWIELAISIAILLGARSMRNGISSQTIAVVAISVALISSCLLTSNPISRRFFADDNGSAHSRVPLMHLAFNMTSANPVLGVGANNFAAVMSNYAGTEFRHEWLYTVHNQFLLVCSETGLIGLAAYLWIYFDIIRRGWRFWNTRDKMFAPLGLGIVAAICGFISHMFVEPFSSGGVLQLIWISMALLAVCDVIRRSELVGQTSSRNIEARPR
jgi:O-antigen ligase